jgi:hypothetical protein
MERIKLFKGDDTDFNGNNFLTIYLDTTTSLTGFKATFRLGSFVQEFADITSKTLKVVIPHEVTKQFPVGNLNGMLRLEDSSGRLQTVTNTIPFAITKEVFTQEEQEIILPMPDNYPISITLRLLSDNYEDFINKPSINGVILTGNKTSEELKLAFVYEQGEASDTWVIDHDLDKYPSVTVVDSANTVVVGHITYIDRNQLIVRFNGTFKGKAYLN